MSEPSLPKPEAATVKKAAKRPATRGVLAAFGLIVLEILLTVVAAGGLVYLLFYYLNLWSYDRTVAMIVFAVAFVALSLVISLVLDGLTAGVRLRNRKRGIQTFNGPLARLVKLALGGLVLPLAVFTATSLAPLPAGGTLMNMVVASARTAVKLAPPEAVGQIALEQSDPATRVLSIRVLAGLHSPEALAQLMKLAREDQAALHDPLVADALSNAIAAYGTTARDPLILLFQQADGSSAGELSTDLYERYFAPSFEQLQAELEQAALDPAASEAQLREIEAAQARLRQALNDLPAASAQPADPRAGFVLRTFLAMNLKEERDTLTFARGVAGNARFSGAVRGDALLLVAKLGSKSDLDFLFSYVNSQDATLRTRALRAIIHLQEKLSGSKSVLP